MSNKPTIIILCGGRGERLRPLTNTIPKPLIRIKGKPIIGHLVDYLISEKFNKFIFATGYKSKEIKKYIIKKYNKFDISFVNNKNAITLIITLGGSTNAVLHLLAIAHTANIDFKKYLSIIDKNKPDTLMTIYQPESKFGVVHCGKKKLIKYFEEKPLLSHWINIGYFYLNKNQF